MPKKNSPPPPPGFVLEEDIPSPPPGFVLDQGKTQQPIQASFGPDLFALWQSQGGSPTSPTSTAKGFPFTGGIPSAVVDTEPSLPRQALAGFTRTPIPGVEPTLGGRAAQFVGQEALPTFGAAVGTPLGPLGIGGGAAAFRTLQEGLSAGLGAFKPDLAHPRGLGEVLKEGASTGLVTGLGAKAIPAALSGIGKIGSGTFQVLSRGIGGISKEAFERAVERPSQVLNAMSRDPETAPRLAKVLKEALKENLEKAGESYREIINKVVNTSGKYGPGYRLNLQDSIADDVAKVWKEHGFSLPGRLAEEADSKLFNRVLNAVNELKDATPEQVYYLQRDINALSRDKQGTSLGVALGKISKSIRNYLKQTIPEIGQANAIYAKAVELSDEASKIIKSEDVPALVKSAFKRRTETRDVLEEVADRLPEARKALEGIRDAAAGQEFAPATRPMTQTGFLPGVGIGAGGLGAYLAGGPGSLAVAAGLSPFLSPRAIGAGIKAGSFLGRGIAGARPYAAPTSGIGLEQAYQALRGR